MRTQVSAETIDARLYVLPRGALPSKILAMLRQARKARRPRAQGINLRDQSSTITLMTKCPPDVAPARCLTIGMVISSKGLLNGSAIRTLVERITRLVILSRMDGTNATSAPTGFTKKLQHMPTLLRKTVTGDPGKEMAQDEPLAQRLAIKVFFADPYSPRQRGTNENTNGLLRQYLPNGTDLSGYTQRELNAIAHQSTPQMKCLDVPHPWKSTRTCAIIHPLHSLVSG
jgi:transposase, IS30 family